MTLKKLFTNARSPALTPVLALLYVLLTLPLSGMNVSQVPLTLWTLALLVAALAQLGVQMVKRGHLSSSLLEKAVLVGSGHAISFGLSIISLSAFSTAAKRGMEGKEHALSSVSNILEFNLRIVPILIGGAVMTGLVVAFRTLRAQRTGRPQI